MTTPANLTYTDVQTRVANALRIPTSNTTEMTKIAGVINAVYRDVAAKKDWKQLIKRSVINTVAGITSLTASVTQNSTSGTFSSAPQSPTGTNVSVAGWVLIAPGNANDPDAVYRIATHTSGATAFTFDAAYTDSTNTAVGVRLYQDSYSLPADTNKVLNVKRFGEFQPMTRMGIEEFSMIKLSDQTASRPEMYAAFDYATTGDPTTQPQLQIHPYPDKMYRMEVFYKQMLNTELSGTTRPFIPDDFVEVIYYGALSRAYPIFMNDKVRGGYFLKLFNDTLALRPAQTKECDNDHPGVRPDNNYRRMSRRRRAGGYTLGSWFDRLPNRP